jgi:hypothetical protein
MVSGAGKWTHTQVIGDQMKQRLISLLDRTFRSPKIVVAYYAIAALATGLIVSGQSTVGYAVYYFALILGAGSVEPFYIDYFRWVQASFADR